MAMVTIGSFSARMAKLSKSVPMILTPKRWTAQLLGANASMAGSAPKCADASKMKTAQATFVRHLIVVNPSMKMSILFVKDAKTLASARISMMYSMPMVVVISPSLWG
jgi:hypothetical protein